MLMVKLFFSFIWVGLFSVGGGYAVSFLPFVSVSHWRIFITNTAL